jgi:5-methylcytosine-specific restriction endonuclease McrA
MPSVELETQFTCPLCLTSEICQYVYQEKLGICARCAEAAANLYNYAHTGDYLTWRHLNTPLERGPKPIPTALKLRVWRRDGFKCLDCGSVDHLSVDHIRPRSLGGSDDFDNLQTLCRRCNSRKGKKERDARQVV